MKTLASASVAMIFAILTTGLAVHSAAQTEIQPTDRFERIALVLQHPRCLNCHTTTSFPKQGDDRHRHTVNVTRGFDGHGAAGLACTTCHGLRNNTQSGVPGADEDWHLAPLSMAWEGLSVGELCRALKDPSKNGGRTGAKIIEHLNTNLVRWAWEPGVNAKGELRSTPSGSHADFVSQMEAWVKSGANCPSG